ncbi:hypothetical protein A2U01_0064145, partial [Trifolium medium]|nr:hypothetical protein [Trifolium medium]
RKIDVIGIHLITTKWARGMFVKPCVNTFHVESMLAFWQ